MLGLESRQFDVTLSGPDVMKDGNRRERAAKKEKSKERVPVKDGASSSRREGMSGKEDDARARG